MTRRQPLPEATYGWLLCFWVTNPAMPKRVTPRIWNEESSFIFPSTKE
jgi:hypothetical protein